MRTKNLKKVAVPGVFAHIIMTDKGQGYEYRNCDGESCDENGVLDKDKVSDETSEQPEDSKKD